jgi:hypothetical protein
MCIIMMHIGKPLSHVHHDDAHGIKVNKGISCTSIPHESLWLGAQLSTRTTVRFLYYISSM